MKRILVALSLILLVVIGNTITVKAEEQEGSGFTYLFTVREDGWIDIYVNFTSEEAGHAWLLVPKFHEYDSKLTGISNSAIQNSTYYFYYNFTFDFSSGAYLEINWSYRFGSLIVEPKGVFFSTAIGYSPEYHAEIIVNMSASYQIENIFLSTEVEVLENEFRQEKVIDNRRLLFFDSEDYRGHLVRVLISFEVPTVEFIEISEGNLKIRCPSRYVDVAENITSAYRKFIQRIMDITNQPEINITLELFVPEDVEELYTLGYTRLTERIKAEERFEPQRVYINMIVIRMPEGTLEETLLHELFHQYMGQAGLSTQLRWVHEGLANYLAIELLKEKGVKLGLDEVETAKQVGEQLEDFGFLVGWRGGGPPPDPRPYYAASLYLIYTLGEEYGGIGLFDKFFEVITEEGVEIDSMDLFVLYLSQAAGEDLTPVFKQWGFDVRPSIETRMFEVKARINKGFRYNPFNWMAGIQLKRARSLFKEGKISEATRCIDDAEFLLMFGPVFLTVTAAVFIGIALNLLSRKFKKEKEGIGQPSLEQIEMD
ncbi:MAG: hypothetical protein DRN92_00780 [Thermoproteota archaeon]|nr:MAG: hypothetical protein DRN92_00780 [Candidatus Korarchaeota archaeon]